MKIIDLSQWNGNVDFAKVKAAGIDGVILRAGFGRLISQKDTAFERYYAGASAAGLHIGAYWFSYAVSAAEAATEASVYLQVIKGKKFDLPIYMDIEHKTQVALSKSVCSAMVKAFCGALERSGYWAGVYSFDSFFASNLDEDIPRTYSAWVARVENITPRWCAPWGIHQYSWLGKVDGISGDVDMDNCIIDYPSLIRRKGLNGYSAATKYGITARIAGLTKAQADEIGDACVKLGMNVVINKED